MASQIPEAQLAALRTLVLAVDTASLTAAGRRQGLTPSAASKQITRLEAALGARLLERTTRRVRPTPTGLALVRRVRPLFEAFDEAAAAVRDERDAVAGRVRISASRAFGRTRLLPLLARLAAEHDGLELDVVLSARRLDFVEDEIDLAVREGPLADSSATARRIGDAEILLCAARSYLERRGTPRRLDDLTRHDLIGVPAAGPASDLARLRGADGRRLGLAPRLRVNDLLAVCELAERGLGVAALPDYVAGDALARGALVRVLPRAAIGRLALHVLYPSRRYVPARVRVVVDALCAAGAARSRAGRR